MATPVAIDGRYTSERYFHLVEDGVLGPDDHVELLDGVIVAMPPSGPPHATAASKTARALIVALADRACVRARSPLVAGSQSVPEPDVAVVTDTADDYRDAHPAAALLVVEVADSSLPQDRITKARIYATARVPEHWILNLRDDCVDVLRAPDPQVRSYGEHRIARRGERLDLGALPGVSVAVDDLLPGRREPETSS